MINEELLHLLPLKRTWLDDIVAVFLKRPYGVADIDAVVTALLKTDRHMGAEGESTVTRTINNYCINAGDSKGEVKHAFFERINPGMYRLLTFPNAPDLIEIQNVQFSDHAWQRVWSLFVDLAKKNPKWKNATKRRRLEAFARYLRETGPLRNLLEDYGGELPIGLKNV